MQRKLNIRALVEIKVWARERVELNIPVAIDSEYPLEELHNTEVYLELCYRGTERWNLKEEVRLPSNKPNIRQLLWQQHQLLGREIRVNQGKWLRRCREKSRFFALSWNGRRPAAVAGIEGSLSV